MDPNLPLSTPQQLLGCNRVRTLVLTSIVAAFVGLAGCQTTPSGRPKSTKATREQRNAVAKSPAQWSIMGDEARPLAGEMDEELTTVDVMVEEGVGPDGSDIIIERRVTRRVTHHKGAPIPPDSGPGPGPGSGPDGADGPKPVHPPVMLGVRMRELDPVLATHLGLDARKCAVIEDVAEELSGYAGGLRDHDIIIAVDGSGDASPSHVRRVLRSKKPGDTIDFMVRRANGPADVKITLEGFDHGKLLSVTPARVGG